MNYRDYLLIGLAAWNLIVLSLYGLDKQYAKRGRRRIPERTLLLCGLFAGGIGALAGFLLFRHKTRHLRFRVLLPLFALATGALAAVLRWPELLEWIRI